MSNVKKEIKKVVLAYSGGLDTSVILKWLQDEYKCEIVTFTADLGQGLCVTLCSQCSVPTLFMKVSIY
jgi:PP-loop superfamily ATP-utilizing enzyme